MQAVIALAFVGLVLGGSGAAAAWAQTIGASACAIDVERELWIRDLTVVEDPVRTTWVEHPAHPSEGAWSFGRLMSHISGLADPAPFVLHLFEQFRTTQEINGLVVPPQSVFFQQIIAPWIAASQASGRALDFSIAPFRLNGFVNRIDLRSFVTHGPGPSAGEGRIVFTVLFPDGRASLTTLILEYALLARDADEVKAWAQAWHDLGSIPFGPDYNQALEQVVQRFAGPGVAPGRPNGSALRQLRTNEFSRTRPVVFGSDPWQWREFRLAPETGFLVQTTAEQTVDTSHNRSALLADFVNEYEAEILAGTFVVPLTYQGVPFRSGASDGEPFTAFLAAPGIRNNDARHLVSLNSCVACHSDETGTLFFHSFPRARGERTLLSGFLTGSAFPDPVEPTVVRRFDDLKRRVHDLCGVLCSPASVLASQRPLARVH